MQFVQHRVEESRSVLIIDVQTLLNSVGFGWLCVLGTLIGSQLFYNSFDDMFITYRYAYNLASGNGFVYNIGERYLGTTAPLFGFVLGILGIPNPQAIPTISAVLGVLALVACGTGLFVYGMTVKQRLVGFLAGTFFMFSPFVMYAFTSEMVVQLALLTWAFICYQRNAPRISAVLLALAVLTRFDSMLMVGVIGVYELTIKRRVPWREIGLFMLTLAPALITMWMYYGDPLPGTLDSKMAQGDSGLWMSFWNGGREWVSAVFFQDSSAIFKLPATPRIIRFIPLVALGLIYLFMFAKARSWWLPLMWSALYSLAYVVLAVPFYHWYIVHTAYGMVVLAALGAAFLVKLVDLGVALARSHKLQRSIIHWITLVGLLVALTPGLIEQYAALKNYGTSARGIHPYIDLGKWLNQHTPADASIGYIEIGFVGYYSQRPIIDALGLVNPNVAPAIAKRDLAWSYRTHRPDYIVHYPGFFTGTLDRYLEEAWFKEEYVEDTQLDFSHYHFIIYKRIPS